jgi:hypothetical protein
MHADQDHVDPRLTQIMKESEDNKGGTRIIAIARKSGTLPRTLEVGSKRIP